VSDTQAAPGPDRLRFWGSRWWLAVIVIFVASRIVTTVIVLVFASVQGHNPWTGAQPDYFDFATIWDGRWYDIVAGWGYPSTLPHDADGHVSESAWAFLPGYPWLVAVVMFITRLPWSIAAASVSAAFALGSSLLLFRMFRLRLDARTSLFAVALFCVAPLSPLLQFAYAESMYLFFLILGLYLLMTRRYWLLLPVIGVMSFVRPSGLAFALAIGLHVVYRWFKRRGDPFPVSERIAAAVATVAALIGGLAWPAIAAVATGSATAYTDTELSWRAAYIGFGELVPFTAWIEGAKWWFSTWLGLPDWVGYLVLALVVAIFAVTLFLPAVKRLGVDLRFWLAAYALYLLAVFFPQSSTFRLLMPMFPLLGALAIPTNKAYRIALVVLAISGQVGWMLICWGVDGADWSPP
jgi:hypothetical protein